MWRLSSINAEGQPTYADACTFACGINIPCKLGNCGQAAALAQNEFAVDDSAANVVTGVSAGSLVGENQAATASSAGQTASAQVGILGVVAGDGIDNDCDGPCTDLVTNIPQARNYSAY